MSAFGKKFYFTFETKETFCHIRIAADSGTVSEIAMLNLIDMDKRRW